MVIKWFLEIFIFAVIVLVCLNRYFCSDIVVLIVVILLDFYFFVSIIIGYIVVNIFWEKFYYFDLFEIF